MDLSEADKSIVITHIQKLPVVTPPLLTWSGTWIKDNQRFILEMQHDLVSSLEIIQPFHAHSARLLEALIKIHHGKKG
jgi:hypothetical protein